MTVLPPLLTRVAVAAASLVAALAGAAPAAATAGATVTAPVLQCVGDEVRGTVQATGDGTTSVQVALVARFGSGAYRGTGLFVRIVPVPTSASYAFRWNVAGLPPGATDYRVEATVEGNGIRKSRHLSDSACAPGAVVPEVPVAVLLPLTLAGTAVLVVRRHRTTAASP